MASDLARDRRTLQGSGIAWFIYRLARCAGGEVVINKHLCAGLAFLFGITALIIGAALFTGCAATPPPPPPVVVQAAPTPAPIPDPYASLSSDVAEAIKHNQ